VFADSIAKHTSGSSPNNPIIQATLGNAFSGLVDAWNAPSPGAALKSLFLGGYNPGVPTGNPLDGGITGAAITQVIKSATKNLGPVATESAAEWVGLAKITYDFSAFAYAYYATCHE
jgi:hypothetical protein